MVAKLKHKTNTKFQMRLELRKALVDALLKAHQDAGHEGVTRKQAEEELAKSYQRALQTAFNTVTDSMTGVDLLIVQYALAHFEELVAPEAGRYDVQ